MSFQCDKLCTMCSHLIGTEVMKDAQPCVFSTHILYIKLYPLQRPTKKIAVNCKLFLLNLSFPDLYSAVYTKGASMGVSKI